MKYHLRNVSEYVRDNDKRFDYLVNVIRAQARKIIALTRGKLESVSDADIDAEVARRIKRTARKGE